jgi:chromosome segregation ATPase
MDSIGVVLGVLAMFVALAGVFFSSNTMKKIDEGNAAFIKSHLDPLTAELAELKGTVSKTRKLVETHQSEFAAIKDVRKELATAFRDIEIRLESLKSATAPARAAARPSWQDK